MKRIKHHKIKREKLESSSHHRVHEEHDLAYYIHDRVELMHQVFSIIKYKELKSMAPECVRNLAIGDLEELCTEELLGISSKRLLAILDGVEPPSDTESSSPSPPPEQLETISLDSISSDEELLTSTSKKKKHKHRRHNSKPKSKKKEKSKEAAPLTEENNELSRASRAGLTVLELLELQARARAIRAQLQQEQANKRPSETTVAESSHHSSENEVEIKEEPPDVVEISSEDEKPDIDQLKKNIAEKPKSPNANNTAPPKEPDMQRNPQTVTKRINDLIITVPQTTQTRKIKLNRNKVNASTSNETKLLSIETNVTTGVPKEVEKTADISKKAEEPKEGKPKKKKKDKKKKVVEKDGSDHDEITLQLSDSEKMDLFEDLDESRKHYDKVSSSSEDSESSSSDSDDNSANNIAIQPVVETKSPEVNIEINKQNLPEANIDQTASVNDIEASASNDKDTKVQNNINSINENIDTSEVMLSTDCNQNIGQINDNPIKDTHENHESNKDNDSHSENQKDDQVTGAAVVPNETMDSNAEIHTLSYKTLEVTASSNATRCDTIVDKFPTESCENNSSSSKAPENDTNVKEVITNEEVPLLSSNSETDKSSENQHFEKNEDLSKKSDHGLSDGELSDHQSSEIEAIDVQPEVVCISDEESPKKKLDKKKKKKEKKSKKEKKTKKTKSDFCKDSDQNFYKDDILLIDCNNQDSEKCLNIVTSNDKCVDKPIDLDSDDVYEILELSDDSSCYEVEGTVLSKEPTAEEIEALSARIDEIEREEIATDEQKWEHEQMIAEKETSKPIDENIDNISWKDRYLDSAKVKKVLTTANILNALRKKNKELKKKIQDSKKTEEKEPEIKDDIPKENDELEEGSIEQYNALQGSTKYVHPVEEPVAEEKEDGKRRINDDKEESEKHVAIASDESYITKEMKKDARQLLKMYRKLLKYNDMKQKDSSKKKKKKQKKKDKQANEMKIASTNLA